MSCISTRNSHLVRVYNNTLTLHLMWGKGVSHSSCGLHSEKLRILLNKPWIDGKQPSLDNEHKTVFWHHRDMCQSAMNIRYQVVQLRILCTCRCTSHCGNTAKPHGIRAVRIVNLPRQILMTHLAFGSHQHWGIKAITPTIADLHAM